MHFIEDAPTREAKAAVLRLGEAIAEARAAAQCGTETARAAYASLCEGRRQLLQRFRARFYELPTAARVAIDAFLTVSNKEIVGAKATPSSPHEEPRAPRLPRDAAEIAREQAMFLAYEDPFEKYRALLFEYAHTLGHAVEAWLAGAIDTARASGVGADIVEASWPRCWDTDPRRPGCAEEHSRGLERRHTPLDSAVFSCTPPKLYHSLRAMLPEIRAFLA